MAQLLWVFCYEHRRWLLLSPASPKGREGVIRKSEHVQSVFEPEGCDDAMRLGLGAI